MSKLQAVVLAGGKGNRLELVGNEQFDVWDDWERALLPLAGIPLFWYPLNVLAKNGITDVLLITNSECVDKIKHFLCDGKLPQLLDLNVEVMAPTCQGDEQFEEFGSAEVLQMFAHKIQHDFIVLTGYFVSDISLQKMIKMHYEKNSILTCLLSDKACKSNPPGPNGQQLYRDFIGICEDTDQLVFMQSEEELDPGTAYIEIRNTIDFNKTRRVEFTSAYTDCHVYLMNRRIIDVLTTITADMGNFPNEREFSSIKVDLIPFLLERQFKEDAALSLLFESSHSHSSPYTCNFDEDSACQFRVFGYKATPDDATIIAKCNTLGAYLETSKAILELKKPFLPVFLESLKYPGTKVNVIKSRIDASSKIGQKEVNVVKSSVGENCNVAESVKVEDSVVMNGVKIESGCQIKRCIIGRGVKIGQGCKLQNCVIEADHVVNPKTAANNTFIQNEKEWEFDEPDD